MVTVMNLPGSSEGQRVRSIRLADGTLDPLVLLEITMSTSPTASAFDRRSLALLCCHRGVGEMSELAVLLVSLRRNLGREVFKSRHRSFEQRQSVDVRSVYAEPRFGCGWKDGLGISQGMPIVSNAGDHQSIVEERR